MKYSLFVFRLLWQYNNNFCTISLNFNECFLISGYLLITEMFTKIKFFSPCIVLDYCNFKRCTHTFVPGCIYLKLAKTVKISKHFNREVFQNRKMTF